MLPLELWTQLLSLLPEYGNLLCWTRYLLLKFKVFLCRDYAGQWDITKIPDDARDSKRGHYESIYSRQVYVFINKLGC